MAQTIIMPQLGETVAEGKILSWFKAVGDDVKIGDRLFEVETDKVTVEVEATVAGKLTAINTGNGATAKVGATVAVIDGEATVTSSIVPPKAGIQTSNIAEAERLDSRLRGNDRAGDEVVVLLPFEEVKTPLTNFGKAQTAEGLRITPLARRMLSQGHADMNALAQFAASKNLQKIEEQHVRAFLSAASAAKPSAPPLSFASGDVITLNTIRSKTAQRLTENWQTIPHVFQAIDVDFTEIELVRARHKERFKAETGSSLTYLPFIARAVCIALQSFPQINARFENNALTLLKDINLGIAVDLNHKGLVVPVVHAVQDFTLQGLAKAITRQIDKAKSGKMTAADMSGGTYSITNNGAFGTSFTTPIINAPQVAILSTDAIRKRPAVITTEIGDAIVPRLIGTVGQSFDHRAFDGAYAAAFLSKLKDTLETKKWAGELGETP
jgi:pyruvate/2-oxoglutarate dehydrogenase complex dihydrolipoamide acyltransferase (E2) component